MAQEYKVTNAFIAKDKAGNPKSFTGQYGTFITWNLYFEGDDTKYQTNKKEGASINKGDVLYGHTEVVERGGYSFPTFKSEQKPMGYKPQSAQPSAVSGLDTEKLDYLIGLAENIAEKIGASTTTTEVVLDDVSDEPLDLSSLPF